MVAGVVLGPAVIAGALLPARWLPERARELVILAAAIAGAACGVALVALHDSGETWRSVVLASDQVAIAGAAGTGSWLLVLGLDLGHHRWGAGVLTGLAASSLALFAAAGWVVPALLFWTAGSLALLGLILRASPRRPGLIAAAALVVSDALVIASLAAGAIGDDDWQMPAPSRGWMFWLVAAAALVRAGIVPGLGIWGLVGSRAAPALPILAGGGAVLSAGVAGRATPWLAVGLIAGSIFVATVVAVRRTRVVWLAAGPAALGIGALYVSSDAAEPAGLAVIVTAVVVGLWADCGGRAWVARALSLSFAPATIGFSAIAVAATAAFVRTDVATTAWDKAPWLVDAALLPVALAAAITAGARVGRAEPNAAAHRPAVVALWVTLGAAVALGMKATTTGALEAPIGREFALYAAALMTAVGAALLVRAPRAGPSESARDSATFDPAPLAAPEGLIRPATAALSTLTVASWAGVAAVTLQGLRDGFL